MSEMFEGINAHADQAWEHEQSRAAQVKEAAKAVAAVKVRLRRKKATRGIIVRATAAVIVCASLWLAGFFGLMDVRLTVPLMGTAFAWLAFWTGVWAQFMWPRGGLLNVNAE